MIFFGSYLEVHFSRCESQCAGLALVGLALTLPGLEREETIQLLPQSILCCGLNAVQHQKPSGCLPAGTPATIELVSGKNFNDNLKRLVVARSTPRSYVMGNTCMDVCVLGKNRRQSTAPLGGRSLSRVFAGQRYSQ